MSDPRQLPSLLLVSLQFGLLGLLAFLIRNRLLTLDLPWPAWAALALATALALWAFSANRPGNFNIRPIPKAGGQLVTHGPYRHIRHPMYTAFLLGAWALAHTASTEPAWLAWWALSLVLWGKSRLEERWMLAQHPAYAAYRAQTRRFVPWVY